jgi:hypothetical protein
MVIDAFEPVTTFPAPSCTCTTTLAIALPAVPFVGCVLNTSFEAGPTLGVTWTVEQVELANAVPEDVVPLSDR